MQTQVAVHILWILVGYTAFIVLERCARPPVRRPLARVYNTSARTSTVSSHAHCTSAVPHFAWPENIRYLSVVMKDGSARFVPPSAISELVNQHFIPSINFAVQKACRSKGERGSKGTQQGPKGDNASKSNMHLLKGATGDDAKCHYKY